ncbi:MAG: hypothetical protein F4078_08265 [Acidimicrobiia bacterium]|nr:hypothetical protein [Acidimicrobiia bacterium]MYB24359.1 hypothetical protein [Acidimicrobiia bacterium]MYJ14276.1 hypothetical protein [Acidimicrobiia bacterium]
MRPSGERLCRRRLRTGGGGRGDGRGERGPFGRRVGDVGGAERRLGGFLRGGRGRSGERNRRRGRRRSGRGERRSGCCQSGG